MLKGKYVISVSLRCMKGKSPSGKFSACKQITIALFACWSSWTVTWWIQWKTSHFYEFCYSNMSTIFADFQLEIMKVHWFQWFASHLSSLFSRKQELEQAWESAVNSKWHNFCLAHQFCWIHRENTFSSFKYFLYEEGFDRYLRTSCIYSQIGK